MTQTKRLLRFLKDYGSITAYEAVKELGIMQLSARIIDLEHEGYVFDKKQESAINRYGEKVYFKRYSLKGVIK